MAFGIGGWCCERVVVLVVQVLGMFMFSSVSPDLSLVSCTQDLCVVMCVASGV